MGKTRMLACDLGASNGRVFLGIYEDDKLIIEEIFRFSNDPVRINGRLYWDVLKLFSEIKRGIAKCKNIGHENISSIGIDTWGVSFGLLDECDDLIGNPFHYRDNHADGIMEKVFDMVGKSELFEMTGLQPANINTLFQLFSLLQSKPLLYKNAKTLLMTPDLLNFFLTGKKASEFTISSTTQLLNIRTGEWARELTSELEIPDEIFPDLVKPGTILGGIHPEIKEELGINDISVICVAGHDTASAVAALPLSEEKSAYIICGTWSVLGTELKKPIINNKVLSSNFTNEGGVDGTVRLLRNLTGLWVLQECKKHWELSGQVISYGSLDKMAEDAKSFVAVIDPDDTIFFEPGDMPRKVKRYCLNTGQHEPETVGEMTRCIFESLALKYRYVLGLLESLTDRKFQVIYMTGGGIQSHLLCQLISDATQREVVTGPIEATVFGNLAVQGIALGKISGIDHARKIVQDSSVITKYHPKCESLWDIAFCKAIKFYEND